MCYIWFVMHLGKEYMKTKSYTSRQVCLVYHSRRNLELYSVLKRPTILIITATGPLIHEYKDVLVWEQNAEYFRPRYASLNN